MSTCMSTGAVRMPESRASYIICRAQYTIKMQDLFKTDQDFQDGTSITSNQA